MAKNDSAKFRSGRNQISKCRSCGKPCHSSLDGMVDISLCRDCLDKSNLENEHLDGYHNEGKVKGCPECYPIEAAYGVHQVADDTTPIAADSISPKPSTVSLETTAKGNTPNGKATIMAKDAASEMSIKALGELAKVEKEYAEKITAARAKIATEVKEKLEGALELLKTACRIDGAREGVAEALKELGFVRKERGEKGKRTRSASAAPTDAEVNKVKGALTNSVQEIKTIAEAVGLGGSLVRSACLQLEANGVAVKTPNGPWPKFKLAK